MSALPTAILAPIDDHDRGLAFDLETARKLSRRRALGLFGLAGSSAVLTACGGDQIATATSTATATPTPTATATPTPTPTATATATSCTSYASETNGPYPADGTNTSSGATSNVLTLASFQRQDIRTSVLGGGATAAGVQLDLTLTLADVNNSCAALAGYAVYLWHCDASGQYSLYDIPAQDYLRGVQVSDANGQVRFTTIVPGCYAGRFPHIHFEVFTSLANATRGSFARLISQFALPTAACEAVYADTSVYGNSLTRFRATSITSDGIFGDNTAAQRTAMTLAMAGSSSAGYTGTATVGIAT